MCLAPFFKEKDMPPIFHNKTRHYKCSFLNRKSQVVARTTCRAGVHLLDDVIIGAFRHQASSVMLADNDAQSCLACQAIIPPEEMELINNLRYHLKTIDVELQEDALLADKILATSDQFVE